MQIMIDCHAHISSQSDELVFDELKRAKEAGVNTIIDVVTNSLELKKSKFLREKVKEVKLFTSASTTPHDSGNDDVDDFFQEVAKAAENKELIAIGETGLEYFYEPWPKKIQQALFIRYIELAKRTALPLVIHCRDAFEDLFSIFDSFDSLPGVMLHCFTGTIEEAKKALDRGFYISFSGIVTFKKSTSLQEVLLFVPKEKLLLETDTPYLAPQGYRNKKNEPAFLMKTVEFVSEIRQESQEVVIETVLQNASKLFRF